MSALSMLKVAQSQPAPGDVAALFHRLNRVLPENQIVVCVAPATKVSDALEKMRKAGFSQLPVTEGDAVLGIFSYRSLAEGAVRLRKTRIDLGDLSVEDFVEKVHFAHVTDEFDSIFDNLDRDGAVLIGEPDRLQGIVTAMDLLRYLYGVASPFVLVAEIELTLRALITLAVDGERLIACARASLGGKYAGDRLPKAAVEMEFNDYIQLVGHGDNWKYFAPIFGGMRETVRSKLDDIRTLRNDIFHFKRELTWDDHERLAEHRDWVLLKARIADARVKGRQ
jgi:CBS domain-containing protein